jgi:NADPH:quinone reductase-like Zn-dependent oxidoreductase
MKAARIHAYGNSDQIRIEDVPRPAVGPGDVLVRVRAAGVNPVDWKIREGYLKSVLALSFPYALGQDFAGEIVECGPDVAGFKTGDAVFGFASGTYGEFVSARVGTIAQKPRTIDFNSAAAVPTPGLTAYEVINDVARLGKDQTVLIHGGAGAVGSLAVQFARMKEARVVATASQEDGPEVMQLGAHAVIDYKNERFENRVKDVDVVVDLVGGETLARSYAVVKPGGIIVSLVLPPDEKKLQERQIRGRYFRMERDGLRLGKLADLIDRGMLKVRIKHLLPLLAAKEAQDLTQSGQAHGKVVLHLA